MKSSRTLTELNIIREWLQDSAVLPPPSEATTGYWRFTKHRVLQSLRLGGADTRKGSTAGDAGVVTEMDPDAPVREEAEGRTLAADDAVRRASTYIFLKTATHTQSAPYLI